MPAKARTCAYAVLRRVFEHGAYADRALQSEARALDRRDRGLAMRLSYGAIQRRGTLDHLIERMSERPVQRLDAGVIAALRLGMYELLYLQGAPDRAVVADGVELAKGSSPGGHGLVNAVLRRCAREGATELLSDLREDTPEHAATMHSHPRWIARMWWEQLGPEDARALMAADNEPAELALRVNTLRAEPTAVARRLPARTHTDPSIPEALVLEGPFDVHGSPQWRAGEILAQSRAAMLVARTLHPRRGERVLDLCAAPGGKSTHLAALMGGVGEVVAVERHPKRAAQLREAIDRMEAQIVRVEVRDAAREPTEGPVFDRVLVDPPCSGLGTLQARPDLRWRVTPERVAEMARQQEQLLAAAAAALHPGGVLVYSTCTICAAENERQIERFLQRNSRFALDPIEDTGGYAYAGMRGALQTLPHRDRTAGFFIARLRRLS
jgi:16S rRNA (cytosine967-C5)-methyltransferase